MNDAPSQSQDKFIVRLPDGMRDRIKAAADANNRSMNAEIVSALESWLLPPQASGLVFPEDMARRTLPTITMEQFREILEGSVKKAVEAGKQDDTGKG